MPILFIYLYEQKSLKQGLLLLVRVTGLEPAHHRALEPKSNVSANFTTPAY